uniref:hypothetical protein n=1 Tax=Fusobacterium mortiferum TaxID=850 RepID=UPI003FEE3C28
SSMLRDYGENLLPIKYRETEDKHYITRGTINSAYLGEKVTEEDLPEVSDDNDGVKFEETVQPHTTEGTV